MDEFSTGIQETGGNAGEKSGERSEIEIFDFVNQKPDLTTMDKGLFAEDNLRSLPKTGQASAEPGPRYENAWEEIELRDTERRAQERRRAASGRRSAGRAGRRGAEAGTRSMSGKRTAKAGTGHVPGKRSAEAGRKRVSGKRRALRAAKIKQERIARIRIALIAAVVLLCVLAGILFARRPHSESAIPVTAWKEPAAYVSTSVPDGIGIFCGDNSPASIFF